MQGLCEKPFATSHALYFIVSFFSLCFRTNTHLYPTGITSLGVWIASPNISHYTSEFDFA